LAVIADKYCFLGLILRWCIFETVIYMAITYKIRNKMIVCDIGVNPSEERGHFTSRFGFIMAVAGSAVGIGNIWGFPTQAASNGGGAFLLVLQ